MTPTRVKRHSKAPNRFSSDNPHSVTSNPDSCLEGERFDRVSLANQNILPPVKSSKQKTPTREPLKVKLPKLKKPHLQTAKDQPPKISLNDVKIHKIKLPSFLSKKRDKQDAEKVPKVLKAPTAVKESPEETSKISGNPDPKFDVSTNSNTSSCPKSTSANSSFSSSDGNASQGMEIIAYTEKSEEESSNIRCACGVDDDLGVMVECESCSTWQHGHCINIGNEDDAYEGYICASCTYPSGKAQDSLYQLTVGDKYLERFKGLAKVRSSYGSDIAGACQEAKQKNLLLSARELGQATKELGRVSNSLKVKWRLLSETQYDTELRIWSNPHWSPNDEENHSSSPENLYFVDRCKVNLKLNIRNMLVLMEQRIHLIQYAISLFEASNLMDNNDHSYEVSAVNSACQEIQSAVDQISENLKNQPVQRR